MVIITGVISWVYIFVVIITGVISWVFISVNPMNCTSYAGENDKNGVLYY